MRIVVDAQDGAVFQPDPRRALDLREQNVDLVVQVADLQMPAVERAVLDLGAGVIGHDLAPPDAAADENAFARKGVLAKPAPAGHDEIGRPAVQRRRELAGRNARAGEDGFVIAGEKALGVAQSVDTDRPEMILEKLSRAVLVEWNGLFCLLANFLERQGNRAKITVPIMLGVQCAAARQERSESRGMIVVVPAVQIRPVDRFVLRVAEDNGRILLRGRRRRQSGKPCEQNKQSEAPKRRRRQPHVGLIARLRWRPLSSLDRAKRYRAQRSIRR